MKLSLQENFLILELEKNSLDAHFVKHFILSYIQKVSILQSTIILYPNAMEKKIQSFFTYWIKARSKDLTQDHHLLKHLESMQSPLKIHFKKSTQYALKSTIYLKLIDSKTVRISTASKDLCHYFHTFFKDVLIKPFKHNDSLIIDISSSQTLEKLFNTLQRKEILSKRILFSYDHSSIHKLFNTKTSQHSKVTELLQAYALLESEPNEPFDLVKKRYKKLITTYHPDRVFTQGEKLIQNYTSKFQSLQNAYTFIKAAKVAS